MSSSFEKSVKGATKIKAAPPKSKYIEHILIATHSGEAGVAEVFRVLQNRLRDSTWTVVFKSLITVHLMIREGSPDTTLSYLSKHKSMLSISNFADVQTQGRNIRHYSNYLIERARSFKETKCDFVRGADKRLEKMSVDKGILRETEIVQHQITALLKCDVLDNEPENEITITVFRMLVLDLLAMFHVMNQAMINILGHFFEMSRPDAERAMEIYKNFTKQTDFVVAYLSTARSVEHQTRVEVPKLKHAPVNLGRQLEDYLKDPDFEVNRRQYLAEQEGKGGRSGSSKPFGSTSQAEPASKPTASPSFPEPASSNQAAAKPAAQSVPRGPDPDLIDFFESIEQNQQPMLTQPGVQSQGYPQFDNSNTFQQQQQQQQPQFPQNGFVQQPTGYQNQTHFSSPFPINTQGGPSQGGTNFEQAGYQSYPQQGFQPGLSSIPQDSTANFQSPPPQQQMQPPQMLSPQQTTNPFRLSMMANNPTGSAPSSAFASPPPSAPSPITRQSTNPFAKSTSPPTTQQFSSPPPQPDQQNQQPQQPTPAPLRPMATGTNPFAKNIAQRQQQTNSPPVAAGLVPQPTGSTNPFRQSQFVNTNTGQAWQNNQTPMGGGLDALETVPVFPRPANQQPWQS